MEPLVYRAPLAMAFFVVTAAAWGLAELRIAILHRGGAGENLDRGSRVWVVAFVAAGLVVSLVMAWQPLGHIEAWWPVVVGLAITLAGVALRAWAVATLGALFTTSVEVQAGHRVVDGGPYAWLRHPSYTGALLSVVGVALALGNWLGCAVAALLALTGLVGRILVEERALASRLGPSWEAFARRRRRLIPFIW